jgi:cyanate permease
VCARERSGNAHRAASALALVQSPGYLMANQ